MSRATGPRPGARGRKDPAPAAAIVDAVLRRYGVAGEVREHRLVTRWHEIVGERIAARAWPDGLKDGVLRVRVSNSAWLHELSFLREAIGREANRVAGAQLVRDVRFHLGGRRARAEEDDRDDVVAALSRRLRPRRAPAPPRKEPSAAVTAAIDAETARVEDPALREAIRALRRKLGV